MYGRSASSPSRAPTMIPASRPSSYAPPRYRLPRRYTYVLLASLAAFVYWGYSNRRLAAPFRPAEAATAQAAADGGGLAAHRAGGLVDAVDLLAENVLPQLYQAPKSHTFEDHYASVDFDEDDETEFVAGVPGYMLFHNIYVHQGILYAVTPDPSTFPDASRIMSRDEHGPAEEDEWQVITPSEARKRFGSRIARLAGDTMFFADGPPVSFLDHWFHFVVECLSGAWRVLSSTAALGDPTPPPERVIFSRAPRWRDGPGLNSWFLQAVLPATHIEDRDGWNDRSASDRVYRFDRVVIVDRWASHRHNPSANHWNKMNADVYDQVPAPDDWWDPIRAALMFALEIPDIPISEKPVLTYVDRQGVSKRRISEATHGSLLDALYEIEEEGLAQVYDAQMEKIPKREQFGLSSRTDILLGVHGNGLSHLMWLPRGSHIIEIFAPGGFTRDYQMLTTSLGHHHYAVWEDKVYLESEWKHAAPHFETEIDFQGTEIPIDGKFIKTLVEDIVKNNGRNFRQK